MLKRVILSNNLAFILYFSEYKIIFFADHGYLIKENGALYTVATSYKAEDLNDLQFTQNGDVLYIFHPKYKPKTLSRYGNLDWRLEDLEFKNGPWDSVNTSDITMRISRTTQYARVIASGEVFKESDVGRLIRLTVKDSNKTAWQAEKDGIKRGDILYSDSKYYRAKGSGKTGTVKPVHSEGTISDGSILFQYAHSGYGQGKIIQYFSPTEVDISIEGEMPDSLISVPTDYWELGLLHSGIDNPICGSFFRNRFCFMVKNKEIPYVCFSCSDDYNNFADKDNGEVLATNAITVPITSTQYNEGRWLCSSDVLFVGTSSGEFYIDSASSSEAMGPENVKIQQISEIGSKAINPIKIGSHLFFIERNGTAIRDIIYSFTSDAYDPVDMSLYGKHLLSSGITNMIYQESPDKIIWFTTEDGRLIGLTFSDEQNVRAFHQHNLSGKVRNIEVIPNPQANLDDLWLGIDRNGIYSIEWMDNGIVTEYSDNQGGMYNYDFQKRLEAQYIKENAFFVDGGLSIERNTEIAEKGIVNIETSDFFDAELDVQFSSGDEEHYNLITAEGLNLTVDRRNTTYMNMTFTADSMPYCDITFSDSLRGASIKIERTSTTGEIETEEHILSADLNSINLAGEASFQHYRKVVILLSGYGLNKQKIQLHGLDHLEGREVAIMADGAERERQIVKNGSIEVWSTDKHIVAGLPIESAFIPQTMYIQGNNGSGVGDVQRIDHVTLMLWQSLGGKIGSSFKDLQDIYLRKTDDDMNESAPLFSGNKTIYVCFNTSTIEEKGASMLIYNDSVFPMNILAIAPHFSTSGNGL